MSRTVRRTTATVALLVGLLVAGVSPASAQQPYAAVLTTAGATVTPGVGHLLADGRYLLDGDGHVDLHGTTRRVTTRVYVPLQAFQCEGAPRVTVSVDGVVYLDRVVYGTGGYALVGSWPAGDHTVRIRMSDQHATATCHRRLAGSGPDFYGWPDGSTYVLMTGQSADLANASITGHSFEHYVLDHEQIELRFDATVSVTLDSQGARFLDLTAWTWSCDGSLAHMRITLDDAVVYDGPTRAGSDTGSSPGYAGRPADGTHTVTATVSDVPGQDGGCVPQVDLTGFAFGGYA